MRYRIVEDRLGAAFDCVADDVVLRAGLRVGVPLAYECNVGGCGSCKFELLDGQIVDAWPAAPGLSERDRLRGRHLACQSRPISDCRIRMIGRGEVDGAPLPKRMVATLAGIEDLTHDMREFRFRVDDGAAFRPGQYALLSLPGVPVGRAYSMSNIDNDAGEWHFIIRRVPAGMATPVLFDLEPGAPVRLDGPYGRAYLRPNAGHNVVCIAGGSGLSPMVAIARGLDRAALPAECRFDFFYGGRSAADICGEAFLRALPRLGNRLHFHPVVSSDDVGWTGRKGMVHELLVDLPAETFVRTEFYLAGPPPMVEAVVALLARRRAVPAERIHYDRFF
jgi:toluene monooxygenase electron transfer component